MKLVAHLNNFQGPIDVPVILIAESPFSTAEEIKQAIPAELNPIIIEEDSIPDRSYVRAFKLTEQGVEVDMNLAREVVRTRVRRGRMTKLQELDVQFQRALEQGLPTEDIVAQKQALRDAPDSPAIDAAQTIEELDSVLLSLIS